MQIECRKEEDVLVVKPLEETVDTNSAQEFKDHLTKVISEGNDLIVLDTAEIQFIDSSALGVIISVLKSLNGKGEIAIASRLGLRVYYSITSLLPTISTSKSTKTGVDES